MAFFFGDGCSFVPFEGCSCGLKWWGEQTVVLWVETPFCLVPLLAEIGLGCFGFRRDQESLQRVGGELEIKVMRWQIDVGME